MVYTIVGIIIFLVAVVIIANNRKDYNLRILIERKKNRVIIILGEWQQSYINPWQGYKALIARMENTSNYIAKGILKELRKDGIVKYIPFKGYILTEKGILFYKTLN